VSIRTEKVAATIERLAAAYLHDVQTELNTTITVVRTEVSPDIKHAKLYVSTLNDRDDLEANILTHQKELQHVIATELKSKFTPKIELVFDRGPADSARISQLLRNDQ
jgi:ribosome-binding factor A